MVESREQARRELAQKLNLETARLGWDELARHFARGSVIRVAATLDLVAVATAFATDDSAAVSRWLEAGEVAHADIDDARRWERDRGTLWAVVVAPWVLVQEAREA